MRLITLDFETYYDAQFSLSKMTTEEYIRDQRFEVIGCGIKIDTGPTEWYPGFAAVQAALREIDWSDSAMLAHNTAFDGAIAAWHFGVQPAFYFDTLSMARPLHGLTVGGSLAALAEHYALGAKGTEILDARGKRLADFSPQELARYGDYCRNDVELTLKLFKELHRHIPPVELEVIDLLLRMYTRPLVELDGGMLRQHLAEVRQGKTDLVKQAVRAAGDSDRTLARAILAKHVSGTSMKDLLMSNDLFAAMLRTAGVEPPTKISPRTGKTAWAFAKTDKAFKELLEHEAPVVSTLVAARLGVKTTIEETRTQRFIAVSERGALPIMLRYYGAHTGRCSGGEKLNLQNLPRGGTLRKAMKAPAGHKMVVVDSAQIEARMLAWLAGENWLVEAFARDTDAYSLFAKEVYGYEVTNSPETKKERQVGKVSILGLGYGMGAVKFRDALRVMGRVELEPVECERVVALYRRKHSAITRLWKDAAKALSAMERGQEYILNREGALPLRCADSRIYLPNGLWLSYPNLTLENGEYLYDVRRGRSVERVRTYGPKLIENIVQALARIVVFEQMVSIGRELKALSKAHSGYFQVVLTVHDEVVAVAPEPHAQSVLDTSLAIMSRTPEWAPGLPVACEGDVAVRYGEAK